MTETRAEKAQRLVDKRRVKGLYARNGYTGAHVKGDHGEYDVILRPGGRYYCLCEWGEIHWNSRDLCAHALAVKLMTEKEN